ncbi:MAG: aminotransferase class III-fold pyridoxal phosphate-dependent enzyme, partial [Bdellovibrionota bacterium]
EGVYMYDTAGKRYVDGSGGALVTSVGYGNKEVIDVIVEQITRAPYVNGNHFTSAACEELARLLCERAPGRLDRAFFLSSGSEAIEAAIKFARQYCVDSGKATKYKVIARTPGYHGNTLFALSASGRPRYKKFFGPLLHDVVMVQTPYEYRAPLEPYEGAAEDFYVSQIEDAIKKEGADSIACMLMETVSGTSTGGSCAPKNYFRRVQKICRDNDILMIADEVLCGMGRTGTFYACEQEGFEPDLLVLGKGLNGGYAPLSAMLTRTDLVDVLAKNSGSFMHAQTYINTPSSVAAGLGVVRFLDRHRVIEKSRATGDYLRAELKRNFGDHPLVGHIGGRGMLAGVEFVKDKITKAPIPRSLKASEGLGKILFEKGLVTWFNTGQIDGTEGDVLVLGPPLTIKNSEIDEMIAMIRAGLDEWYAVFAGKLK